MKSIADVVGASGLAGYAEVALLLFFLVFVVVSVRALATNRAAIERAARLPLDDETPISPPDGASATVSSVRES
jgi:cbb3-type cytochrome oxidase subunit 3